MVVIQYRLSAPSPRKASGLFLWLGGRRVQAALGRLFSHSCAASSVMNTDRPSFLALICLSRINSRALVSPMPKASQNSYKRYARRVGVSVNCLLHRRPALRVAEPCDGGS